MSDGFLHDTVLHSQVAPLWLIKGLIDRISVFTPKGLYPSAQGKRSATLGSKRAISYPERVSQEVLGCRNL